ncbi:MAG: biliverdin-producing heme oxygenase [Gammaproteobacteria bacterium]|nr:MAG: biliverdin-producing heme oxygenase [Gammaproteobacteria bacterium]
MGFYQQLQEQTAAERTRLMQTALVRTATQGPISLQSYIDFLTQAYHHVKHTLPLLMAAGARMDDAHGWLRVAIAEYIEEETGHEEWILNDIRACGGDADAVRHGQPAIETELMVSYAYDTIARINPVGFFGMVQVLEGTSVKAATIAAQNIQQGLGLPNKAFTYLLSHGDLDQDHIRFFESLMDKITDPAEQALVVHCAKVFYRLYGDIFRSLVITTPDGQRIKEIA